MLKPIGTVFKQEFPPSECSTNGETTIITYEVVAHVLVMRWENDTEGKKMEELKAIDIDLV